MCIGEHPISLELVYPPAGDLPAVMSLYTDGRVVIFLGELLVEMHSHPLLRFA